MLDDTLVGAEAVVVRAVVRAGIRPDHHTAAGSIASQKEVVAVVHVGRGVAGDVLADDGVVVGEQSGGLGGKLEGDAAGDVVEDVADEIGRAAEDGLRAVAAVRRVDAAVVVDADVVHAAVGFDEVVA